MPRIHLDDDIAPLSAFRADAARMVQELRQNGRPLVLTQHGRSAAVVMAVPAYERLMEELELLRDVRLAETQLEAGEGIDHEAALAQLLERLGK